MGNSSPGENSKKPSANNRRSKHSKSIGSKYFRSFASFLIGTIFGLFIVGWFVSILPGPKVSAAVSVLRGTTTKTSGCIYYTFFINNDKPIEHTYLKIQFPGKINNFKVGLPQEAQTKATGKVAMQVWVAGKDVNGSCTIKQAAIDNSTDVQASASGNMISVHSSKLPSKTFIMGMVATTEGESTIKPIPANIYAEGAYEYLKLGQTVRKPLKVVNNGVTETK